MSHTASTADEKNIGKDRAQNDQSDEASDLATAESKRKRSEMSSTSEVETSIVENKDGDVDKNKGKQKKKKQKQNENSNERCQSSEFSTPADLVKQMKTINEQLVNLDASMKKFDQKIGNVMMKDDSCLKDTIKKLFGEMKDDLLRSVIKNLEVIEGKLYDKELEIDKLKTETQTLQKCLESQRTEFDTLQQEVWKIDTARKKAENEVEQYSRRNNIKISGIDDTQNETATETAKKVIKLIQDKKIYDLRMEHIDVAHRIPNKGHSKREVIVKFVSRNVKEAVMKNRKLLKGSGIFINDDLTRTNFQVLMCVKKKQKDEVKEAWSVNGKILYRSFAGHVHVVKFEEYEHWLELPWPQTDSTGNRPRVH